jgi:predicted metal-dependent hydrolase
LLQGWLKRTARPHLERELAAVAAELSLQPKRLHIRLQRTRWGSCSSTGTISLNAAMLLRPPAEMRYVIIHELCHLRHMNHSARFWRLVERYAPDYRDHEQALDAAWPASPLWLVGRA